MVKRTNYYNRLTQLMVGAAMALTIVSCAQSSTDDNDRTSVVINPNATPQTVNLFLNLQQLGTERILFGHQDALAYGIGWWNEDFRSDVADLCGDHPAIFGWDLGKIGRDVNIDSVSFDRMKYWIKQVYKRGGINTISWHEDNPVTGGSTWDRSQETVKHILPGGSHHEAYLQRLNLVAEFLADLTTSDGTPIPIIFRPYHEHTGHWFWWGETNCTREEFIALWRLTYHYLVDCKNLNNLLWAYSPDRFGSMDRYMARFPGVDYVDVLGFDNYGDLRDPERVPEAMRQLRIVVELADSLGKIATLSETGHNKIPIDNWWTEHILNPIINDSITNRIAWVMVWRNADPTHQFGPSPGHSSAPNFIEFYNHPTTAFLNDIPNVYASPSTGE